MVNFQILDISTDDLEKNQYEKEFIITLYGKTNTNEKVVCHVKGFEPYFFIKVPKCWSANMRLKINNLLGRDQYEFNDDDYHIEKFVKGGYGHRPRADFLDSKTDKIENIDFYGFQCNDDRSLKTYLFAKLTFQSYVAMQKYIEAFREVYSHLHRRFIDGTLDTVSKIHKEWFLLDKNEQCDPVFVIICHL